MTDRRSRTRLESQEAERVVHALNAFIGVLYAARMSALIWRRHVEHHPIMAKYALQMSDGTILLTLRKFDDLWLCHLQHLLSEETDARKKAEWIINEIKARHLRTTANQLIAHYSAKKKGLPLLETKITDLVKKNGWATEEELLTWVGSVIWNLVDVRDEICRSYGIPQPMDEAWMKDALGLISQEQDTARGGPDEPGNG